MPSQASACTAGARAQGAPLGCRDNNRTSPADGRPTSQMGGVYDVVEISMISRGMTAECSSYDLWMISYKRYLACDIPYG